MFLAVSEPKYYVFVNVLIVLCMRPSSVRYGFGFSYSEFILKVNLVLYGKLGK